VNLRIESVTCLIGTWVSVRTRTLYGDSLRAVLHHRFSIGSPTPTFHKFFRSRRFPNILTKLTHIAIFLLQKPNQTIHPTMISAKSRSIPITLDEKTIREENEQYQRAMVADFKDLIFCTRLVDSMRKQQMHRRDVSLKYQNQALIDHIIDTRRSSRAIMPHPSTLRNHTNMVVETVKDVFDLVQDDDLIFEMEL
jgi:hypothetical protein